MVPGYLDVGGLNAKTSACWPYDELNLILDEKKKHLSLSTHWLSVSRQFSDQRFEVVKDLSEKHSAGALTLQDRPAIDWLFSEVSKFPLAYILPELKVVKKEDFSFTEPQSQNLSVNELISRIADQTQDPILSEAKSQLIENHAKLDWTWDKDAALNFASIEGAIHPESLLSVARRFHNLDIIENAQDKNPWETILSSSPEELGRMSSLVVRQNHFVTEKCFESLSPAKEIAGASSTAVAEFASAEKGHDKILGLALKEMGYEPSDVPVSPTTRLLMATLKFAASTNFLAFTLLVDAFERSNYQEEDPMAQLLVKAGHPKAAKYINRHMDINDMGEHENMAFSFLEKMPLCRRDYALEALRIAELGSRLISKVAEATLALNHSGE